MEELKKFRTSKRYTMLEFAELIGVSLSLYSKVETGQRKPSRQFVEKLKKKFPSFNTNKLY